MEELKIEYIPYYSINELFGDGPLPKRWSEYLLKELRTGHITLRNCSVIAHLDLTREDRILECSIPINTECNCKSCSNYKKNGYKLLPNRMCYCMNIELGIKIETICPHDGIDKTDLIMLKCTMYLYNIISEQLTDLVYITGWDNTLDGEKLIPIIKEWNRMNLFI